MGCPMPSLAPTAGDANAGFVVEVAGRINAEYASLTAALKAGLELKNKDALAQVKVYDARERA